MSLKILIPVRGVIIIPMAIVVVSIMSLSAISSAVDYLGINPVDLLGLSSRDGEVRLVCCYDS